MNQLVIKSEPGKDVTTSLLVAEVFGKQHKDVLRDIKSLGCSEEFNERNFALKLRDNDLGHGRTRQDPYYEITKDGFSFLVMGYTGEKAAKFKEHFINEFNKREALLKDDEYIVGQAMAILMKRTKRLEEEVNEKSIQVQQQQRVIEEQAPKVRFVEEVLSSTNTWTTTTIAKELGMSAVELNKVLHNMKVQFRQDKHWVLYSKYQDMGLMKARTFTYTKADGSTGTNIESVWTEKGRKFIHDNVGSVQDKAAS